MIKIRAKIKETKNRKTIKKMKQRKSWFFDMINKTDKPLARLTKKNRKRTQINKIISIKGEITRDTREIQRIIGGYYEQLYVNKLDNLENMENIFRKKLLIESELRKKNLNRSITSKDIESAIYNIPTRKAQEEMALNFIKHLHKN